MIDNRLDYIGNFLPGVIEKMSQLRQLYIALDNELVKLGDSQLGHRNLALARTDLEQSLMNAIKVLCLQGEKKHNEP